MTDQSTVADALRSAISAVEQISDSARLDAEVLLCHVLDKPRSYLFAYPEKALTELEQQRFSRLVASRKVGHPVAHLIGVKEFWSLPLKVTPDTLIPRPETELLVQLAIDHIRGHQTTRVLDLGTGSGAVALAVASECPDVEICACDTSAAALDVARKNAAALSIDNVQFIRSNWFENIPLLSYDLIVSNPPYIEEADRHLQCGDVAFEPRQALASGIDGLDAIRSIAQSAPKYLRPGGGKLAVEHGFAQGTSVRDILGSHGFVEVETRQDLLGLDRVSSGTLPAGFE